MTTSPAPATNRDTALWSLPAWKHAFPAAVISRLGDFVFDTTVVLWIGTQLAAGRSWAPSAVSGVLVAAALPVLFVGPVAGVFCDRHDRHRILLWSNVVQAASMASLLLVQPLRGILGVAGQLAWIYAAVIVTNAAGQFFTTARMVMIQATIPDQLLTKAFALQGGANNVIAMVGPPLAAPLLFTAGVSWALLLNAASFLASSILLSTLAWDSSPPTAQRRPRFWSAFAEGVAAIRSNRVVVAILLAITVATLGSGIINTLEVFFVTDVLHSPASSLGILGAAFAVGTIAGMSLATRAERVFGAAQTFLFGVGLVGLLTVGFSRSTTFVVAAALYVLMAIPLGALNTVTAPLFMRSVSPELLGRAMATMQVFPTLASLLSIAVTGWLASSLMRDVDFSVAGSHFGPIDSLFALAGLMMIVATVVVWRPIRAQRAR